jgi:hypothetical protein
VTVAEPERKQACELAATMKAGGKLDGDSLAIADDVMDSNFCKSLIPAQLK